MARRSVTFDVKVNTPSAQQEAQRVANIFSSKLSSIKVGTAAGSTGSGGSSSGGGGGGGGSRGMGMPGSSINNLLFGSAQFALAGQFYHFFSNLPQNIMEMDKLATANKRSAASFNILAGGAGKANEMIDAYVRGTGMISSRAEATESAMKLFNLGLANNAQQMQKFTTVSRGMAQATGRDPQYIQEQFSLAMSNQSLLRFDQLGLSIQRHKEIMADLQRQYPEMTREVAFQNAMLQQATERYYGLSQSQEALATSTEIATRQLKDFYAVAAEHASQDIMQPIAAIAAKMMGAQDPILDFSLIDQHQRSLRSDLDNLQKRGGPNMLDQAIGGLFYGRTPTQVQGQYNADVTNKQMQMQLGESIKSAMVQATVAENAGVKLPTAYIDTIKAAEEAYSSATPDAENWNRTLALLMDSMARATDASRSQEAATLSLGDQAAATAMQIEGLADSLLGSVVGMVGKLVDVGADAATIEGLLPSQEEIETRAKAMVKAGELAGDAISDEIATKLATKELNKPAEDFVQNSKDAASGMKKAATAAESAAKKWEQTVNTTADKLKSAFSSMLHSIPGLYGPSEVSEGDLYLAQKGYAINKPDDWLRRLNDVALNKTKRSDVDLGLIARAVGHPGETDPMALMYLAQQAMADQSIYANPELAKQLINPDAVKAGLHGQEMSALGNQTLDAMFGIGTPEGNDYLKVFGVKAIDPIQEGFISEITTKGPQMGGMMADQMHEGFTSQARSIPWVAELMKIMTDQVGRTIAADQNSNASGDLATSESVPYTTPATSSNGLSYR